MTTEPAAELTPARAEQIRIGAAIRASALPPLARLLLWTASDAAAAAADAGEEFSISIEELSEQTGLHVGLVARFVSRAVEAGWIARIGGRWLPTVPAPRTAP
jgi:predicted Rossmann fold nucleotide-binding protein DprA/Smf involved in DNA uptake